ncbi:MAG: tetratricopeptide repeat protein [Anaerolineales bacterium]|nr:tetratricopeptide repeat protein [Anaerolineales bacterium]
MFNSKNSIWYAGAVILAAILIPVIFTGYSSIKRADSEFASQNYAKASEYYQQAARLLPWRTDLSEKAGIAAYASNDYSTAIAYLRKPLPRTEQGWLALGNSYLNMNETTSALQAYQQGLRFYDSASLYSGLAFIYRGQKDWPAERDALQNQLRLDISDAYTHYRLGLLLTFLAPQQALSELTLASSLDPETDSAVQTLTAALNLSATQPDASEQMLTIGRALGLVQEWELSLAAFEKAIELDGENAEAWAWLGEAKQQIGQNGSVELDRALTLDHKSVIVRALRGLYWNRQGKYEQMRAEYALAAEFDPANPAWQASLGDAYLKLGDLASALNSYQRAAELAPTDPTYWRLLAVFCAENGIHVEDIGLPAAQNAAQLAPNDPFALDTLGWAYLSSGRYANAEQTLLDVISSYPNHFPAYIHLAMTHLAQGNRAAAFNQLTFVRDADAGGNYAALADEMLKQYFP